MLTLIMLPLIINGIQDADMVAKFHPHCVPLSQSALQSVTYEDTNKTNLTNSTTCCVICADKFINTTICRDINMTCQHSRLFHNLCIQSWLDISLFCPICRAKQPEMLCSLETKIARQRLRELEIRTDYNIDDAFPTYVPNETSANPEAQDNDDYNTIIGLISFVWLFIIGISIALTQHR
eukprot:479876_1